MTYESLHDDDDFRVNWCRNMDSFLFICAQDDHAAPHMLLCTSRANRRDRAVGHHWAARRDRADRIHPASGLPADAFNWAPPSGCERRWARAGRRDRADRL